MLKVYSFFFFSILYLHMYTGTGKSFMLTYLSNSGTVCDLIMSGFLAMLFNMRPGCSFSPQITDAHDLDIVSAVVLFLFCSLLALPSVCLLALCVCTLYVCVCTSTHTQCLLASPVSVTLLIWHPASSFIVYKPNVCSAPLSFIDIFFPLQQGRPWCLVGGRTVQQREYTFLN